MNSVVSWSDRIDQMVNATKWPMAVAAVVVTPALCWAILTLAARLVQAPTWSLFPFGCGVTAFVCLWRRWLGKMSVGRWMVTFEHEVTHAMFAFLTGHKIVGMRASVGSGGEVRFEGRGNWLITAAPYFFPTAALVLSLLAYLLPFPNLPWPSFLLGIALGYHLVSTYRETHRDQTDLKELGNLFAWMFLPAANLAMVGFLIAFAYSGTSGVQDWLADCRQPFDEIVTWLQQMVA